MTISFVASYSNLGAGASASPGTITLTVPTGVTKNHLCVLMAANADTYNTAGETLSLPNYWIARASEPAAGNNSQVYIWTNFGGYKAGDTITVNTSNMSIWSFYAVWYDTGGRNINAVSPLTSNGGRSGTSASTVVIPALTTTIASTDILVVSTERTTATGTVVSSITGTSATVTQDFFKEDTGTTGTSGLFGHFTQAAAGSTGSCTITYNSASGNGFGMMLALAPTNKMTTLTDDFTTKNSTNWWFDSTVTVSGNVSIPVTSAYPGMGSNTTYDLTGSEAYLQTVQRANAGNGSVDTQWLLAADGGNLLKWIVEGTSIMAIYVVNGTSTTAFTATYSATTHAWWRIREQSGTTYFDTSTDGSTWTNRASLLNPFPLTAMYVNIMAGYWSTETSPGTAIYDNFNTSAFAAMSTLSDTFATKDTTKWTWGANASLVSGQASMVATAAYDGFITSNFNFDLTNSAAYVQVARIESGTGTAETYFNLYDHNITNDPNKNSFSMHVMSVSGTNTLSTYWKDGAGTSTQIGSATYSATNHLWWRIRHNGSQIVWETSTNGTTWTQLGSAWTPAVPITALRAQVGSGWTGGSYTSSQTALFDNVNTTGASSTVYVGGTNITAVYVGGTTVTAMYIGTTKVF